MFVSYADPAYLRSRYGLADSLVLSIGAVGGIVEAALATTARLATDCAEERIDLAAVLAADWPAGQPPEVVEVRAGERLERLA